MRFKKIIAIFGIAATLLAGSVFAPAKASATISDHPAISCLYNYHPIAPNVVKWCTGWVQSDGFAFRVEMSHHFGLWGGNFDPGRWRVIIDKYYIPTGQHLMRSVDSTFNDNLAPFIDHQNSNSVSFDYVNNERLGEPGYNPQCGNPYYADLSEYYPEHPEYWLVSGGCVLGHGWRQGPIRFYNYPAGTLGGWDVPYVSAWVR